MNRYLPTPEFYLSDDLSMFIMKRFDIQEDESYLGFEDKGLIKKVALGQYRINDIFLKIYLQQKDDEMRLVDYE